jgi:hypothetical protein
MRTSAAPSLTPILAKPIRKAMPRHPEPPIPAPFRRARRRDARDARNELVCTCSVCAMQDGERVA